MNKMKIKRAANGLLNNMKMSGLVKEAVEILC